MQELIIKFNEEQANYLQRLGLEVDAKMFLIDRMFANHASDTDAKLFDSIPFKHYCSEYEKAYNAFELAKKEFQLTYLEPMVKEQLGYDVKFNWKIDDYLSGECIVTIVE